MQSQGNTQINTNFQEAIMQPPHMYIICTSIRLLLSQYDHSFSTCSISICLCNSFLTPISQSLMTKKKSPIYEHRYMFMITRKCTSQKPFCLSQYQLLYWLKSSQILRVDIIDDNKQYVSIKNDAHDKF